MFHKYLGNFKFSAAKVYGKLITRVCIQTIKVSNLLFLLCLRTQCLVFMILFKLAWRNTKLFLEYCAEMFTVYKAANGAYVYYLFPFQIGRAHV